MIFTSEELRDVFETITTFNNDEGWIVLEAVFENLLKMLRNRCDDYES